MKTKLIHLIVIVSFSGIFISCATINQFSPGKGNKYKYIYKLLYPVENSDLLFQDDSVIIQFKFDEAAIRFQLQNISESYISINWDKAAISIHGMYVGIRHTINLYGDTAHTGSILLPPLGYIRDIAIPHDNVYNNGDRWVELDLLPTTDNKSTELRELIKKNIGTRIGLLLPITFGSTAKNYEFDFQVDSVKQIPWKDYEPIQRVPAPPNPKHGVLGLDNVTTAVIVVGILGFSAYVLSIKKNPPSE
jgi:hypothetical protein